MGAILILRHSLRCDSAVLKMKEMLAIDVDLLLGKLFRLWGHVDQHTEDGYLVGFTAETVDLLVECPGLAGALIKVGWLSVDLAGVQVIEFSKYMGVEGIRRLLAEWEKAHPKKKQKSKDVAEWDQSGFLDFWDAYPLKKARKAALKAWNKLRPNEHLKAEILTAVRVQTRSEQWQRGVIPHAATWLNGERWKDEHPGQSPEPGNVGPPGRVRAAKGKYAHLAGQVPGADTQAGTQAELFAGEEPAHRPDSG